MPSWRGRKARPATKIRPISPAISHSAGLKPTTSSSRPPTKKPTPFMAFFEPVKYATHLNNWPAPSADVALMADFDAVLVKSLASPAMPCAATTQATEAASVQPGSSADSMARPAICKRLADRQHARDAEARGQPAAAQIGDDAGEFVEQEQESEREGRVAELEEMQQHQHAQRAVDQGEAPVGRRDDQVMSRRRCHHASASITMLARSTMRQT